MDLLVQDIIKLYPLSRARLLAGKSGLARTVASANIQEVPNVERWLRRGEVLFTAGYAFRELEDLGAFMERIERAGVSAVFVKPGQYLPAVPQEMIDAAERLKLPSSAYLIMPDEEGCTLIAYGLGHGYGMSIMQADRMAQNEADTNQLLSFFYALLDCKKIE